MIEIQKEFAPLTIRIKTKEDKDELLTILHTAQWYLYHKDERSWRGSKLTPNDSDLIEKIKLFIKDLS